MRIFSGFFFRDRWLGFGFFAVGFGIFFQSLYIRSLGFSPISVSALVIALLLPFFFAKRERFRERRAFLVLSVAMFLSMGVAFCNAAFGLGVFKTGLGVLAGIYCLYSWKKMGGLPSKLMPFFEWGVISALAVHIIAWIYQYTAFHFLDQYPELLKAWVGERERIYYGGQGLAWLAKKALLLRPSGLTNEPSTYVLFGLTGVLLMKREDGIRKLILMILGLTSVISGSVTGWMSLALVIGCLGLARSKKVLPLMIGVLLGASTAFVSESSKLNILESMRRVVYASEDMSFRDRSFELGWGNDFRGMEQGRDSWTIFDRSQPFFGRGLGNNDPRYLAGTGLSYLFKYLGPTLAVIYLVSFLALLGVGIESVCLVLLFLVNAPYVQHPIFWLGLSFLAARSSVRADVAGREVISRVNFHVPTSMATLTDRG